MNGLPIAEYDIWMDIVFWTSIISIGNVFMLREYVHEGDFQAPVVSSYQFYLGYQQHPHAWVQLFQKSARYTRRIKYTTRHKDGK